MFTTRFKLRSLLAAAVLAITFGVVVAPSTVSAQDVRTNAMPGMDFSKYKTYRWVNVEGATYPNQILDAQIKQLLDQRNRLGDDQSTTKR